MSKKLIPILTIATLCFTASCGYDKTGTSTEVADSNEDETVNPAHIRGYGDREPGMGGPADPQPNQYYAFNITNLPSDVRNELEGKVAVEMVQTYYDPERQLSDLEQKYNRPGAAGQTMPGSPVVPPDTAATTPGTQSSPDSGTGNEANSGTTNEN
ncbi:MAG: hypothetical protein LPK03_12990 [Pontibacter sp.]|nr:hypothetical protein [Pontibacter sp.]